MRDLQKEFEDAAKREQFEFNKLDLTRHIHLPEDYRDRITQIAWKYFLAGFNAGME